MTGNPEVIFFDLENLRRDRPGIVVVQAEDQGGKGLDIRRQSRETKNGPAIRDGEIAVRPEQICVPVTKLGQEQNRGEGGIKTLEAKRGDHSGGVSDDFRLDDSEKPTCMVNSLLG